MKESTESTEWHEFSIKIEMNVNCWDLMAEILCDRNKVLTCIFIPIDNNNH